MKNTNKTLETATNNALPFAEAFALELFKTFHGVYSLEEAVRMAARAGVAFSSGATSAEVSAAAFEAVA